MVTFPGTVGEMDTIERVQRAATRLVDGTAGMDYEDRLKLLDLFPQSYRRVRGDLITIRHILRGDYGKEIQQYFPLRNDPRRRGHSLTLKKRSTNLPMKFTLSLGAVNLWNALPANVVEEDNE